MTRTRIKDGTKKFATAVKSPPHGHYVLHLYVAGATVNSTRAIANIKQICETHLKGRYQLAITDVYQQPVLAKGEQIIATPTLIKRLPLPLRRFIGDMSNTERILIGLDLQPETKAGAGGAPERSVGE